MYSYDEVYKRSLEYFGGNELSAKVFVDKYCLHDNDENYQELTPDDMHRRLAKEFARIEKKKFKEPLTEDEIYELFKDYAKIICQGSPMYGIGNPYKIISLSNCFVLDSPVDSYGGIMYTDQQLVNIAKRRGGCGISLDHLRPVDSPTNNSSKTSTGVVSFAKRYSNSGREVGQGGRRAALMLTLNVHHPEILGFVHCKDDPKDVTGANISVQLTDEFLNAVMKDEEYELRWPLNTETPSISKMVSAKEVWNEIIKCAHDKAEPGLLFWDHIIRESPADCYDNMRTISTNPCSELPLSELDSCRLMVVNLFSCVDNPYTGKAKFNFDRLFELSRILQRLMDDLVDLELECIDKIIKKIKSDPESDEIKANELSMWKRIYENCKDGRRTGSGPTALGDTIAACGLKYGSKNSVQFVEDIYKTIKLGCYSSSVDMAEELGPFAFWDKNKEKNNPFLLRIRDDAPDLYKKMQKVGRRNIACLTSAPTGSVSTQASLIIGDKKYFNTTSGIEPLFMQSYTRRKKGNAGDSDFRSDFVDANNDHWMHFTVNHSGLQAWMDVTGNTDEDKSPYKGACAEDIDWENRVKLQAKANLHIDHAISSTINLPNDVSVEEVAKIYETAWKSGVKGMTVYRSGCRDGVLIKSEEPKDDFTKRPRTLNCDVHHHTSKGINYFVMVGLLDGKPYEVFSGRNTSSFLSPSVHSGTITKKLRPKCFRAELSDGSAIEPLAMVISEDEEAITRLTSCSLRHGVNLVFLVEQLEKTSGGLQGFAKVIARSLKKYIKDGEKSSISCPTCESKTLVRQEGCVICKQCGWSACT